MMTEDQRRISKKKASVRWKLKNQDKIRAYHSKYYVKNKDELLKKNRVSAKQYYYDNTESRKEYQKQYYQENLEQVKRKNKQRYQENKTELQKKALANYYKNKKQLTKLEK